MATHRKGDLERAKWNLCPRKKGIGTAPQTRLETLSKAASEAFDDASEALETEDDAEDAAKALKECRPNGPLSAAQMSGTHSTPRGAVTGSAVDSFFSEYATPERRLSEARESCDIEIRPHAEHTGGRLKQSRPSLVRQATVEPADGASWDS